MVFRKGSSSSANCSARSPVSVQESESAESSERLSWDGWSRWWPASNDVD